jgi:hypothetical protein
MMLIHQMFIKYAKENSNKIAFIDRATDQKVSYKHGGHTGFLSGLFKGGQIGRFSLVGLVHCRCG